jgi:hypothetical protein
MCKVNTALDRNLDTKTGGRALFWRNVAVMTGRATSEERSATWNLGTNSAFALGPRGRVVYTCSVSTSH